MSYPGTGAARDTLSTTGTESRYSARPVLLPFGSANLNSLVAGTFSAETIEIVALAVGDSLGMHFIRGPGTLVWLGAFMRQAVYPVDVTHQIMLDGAPVGVALTLLTGASGGEQAQSVAVPSGWRELRVDFTASAANAAFFKPGVSVLFMEAP